MSWLKKKHWRWLLLCYLKTSEFSSLPQSEAKEKPTEDKGVTAFAQETSRATWEKYGVVPKPYRKGTEYKFEKSMLFKSSKMLKMGIGSFSFSFPSNSVSLSDEVFCPGMAKLFSEESGEISSVASISLHFP